MPRLMPYTDLCPSPIPAHYVDRFWLSEGGADSQVNRILPDGCVDILIPLSGQIISACAGQTQRLDPGEAYLAGTMTTFADVMLSARARVAGVRFKPFGFSSFSNVSLDGLENGLVPFTKLLTPDLFDESERWPSLVTRLEVQLCRYLCPADPRIQRAVDLILQTGGQVKIDVLVNASCLSVRQFEKKFRQHLGTSAKTLCDVVRVRQSAEQLRNDLKDITQIALDQGYYDTAHFTHAFKRYVGQTPMVYRGK